MIRSIPLPWMVAVACFMMAGILCLEYVRLMFYPTENIGVFEIQNLHFYNMWGVNRDVGDWEKQALNQISLSRSILSQQYRVPSPLYDSNMSETVFVRDVASSLKGESATERKRPSSEQPHKLSQNWTVFDSKYATNWTGKQLSVNRRPEMAGHNFTLEGDKRTNSLNEEIARYMSEFADDGEDKPEVGAVVEMIGRKIQDIQGELEMEEDVHRKEVGHGVEREYENRFAKPKQRHFNPRGREQPLHHQLEQNRRNAPEQVFRVVSLSDFQQRLHSISNVLSSHAKKYEKLTDKEAAKPVGHSRRRLWNPNFRRVGISQDLLRLQGVVIPASPSLEERGWPMWMNTTMLASHLPDLTEVVRQAETEEGEHGISDSIVKLSLNPDIVARGKFQQTQAEQFCQRANYLSILPSNPEDLSTLFTHLLYDDSKKIVFCYVPKNGCSNMKRLLLILNGVLAPESAQQKRPAEDVLKEVKSFKNLTLQGALHRLQNYYKFAIIRHPLERLLSAYRNKVEPRLIYEQRGHFPASTQTFILSHFRREQYRAWLSSWRTSGNSSEAGNSSQAVDIHPTFQEFVQFMSVFPLNEYNEHFSPLLELCHPCAIHYDFYANFKSLHYDLYALMNYLAIPPSYYPPMPPYHSTKLLMREYFGQLSNEDKHHLYHTFRHELDFYTSLHPEEQYSHHNL